MAIVNPHQGPNLRHWRQARKLSLRALAAQAGVLYSSIGQYERGDAEMPYENALKLAKALGIPVAYIWDHIDARTPH